MNIHWLQHVPFEGLGRIVDWVKDKGHSVNCTRLYMDDAFPAIEQIDMLIVMGGPMSVNDYDEYPWLKNEKEFIKKCIDNEIVVLGVCLGAQLIANVLGAAVSANTDKEIGWYPIKRNDSYASSLKGLLPDAVEVLHWHGDTFELPESASLLYTSAACRNQAFVVNNTIIGLQFHLEIEQAELTELIRNCADELVSGRWIQTEEELLTGTTGHAERSHLLTALLDHLASYCKTKEA